MRAQAVAPDKEAESLRQELGSFLPAQPPVNLEFDEGFLTASEDEH